MFALLIFAGAAFPDQTITTTLSARAQFTEPLSLVVLTPAGTPHLADATSARAAVDAAFEKKTLLAPAAEEDPAMFDCAGRLECILARASSGARYVFVLTILPSHEERLDFVSFVMMRRSASRSELAAPEEHLRIRALDELQRRLAGFVGDTLRPALERDDLYAPWGAIALQPIPSGTVVELDDVSLGKVEADRVVIERVRSGRHTLTISRAGVEPHTLVADVARGSTTQLAPAFPSTTRAGWFPSTTTWIGTAIAGIGAGVAIAGAALVHEETNCFTPENCGGSRFSRAGGDSGSAFSDPGEGGLSPVQLGLSVAISGLVLAGVSLALDEDHAWIAYVAGLALGAAAYFSMSALEGRPSP